MFGYVLANEAHLSKEEHSRLRGFYCGLCRTLKSRYGFSGQLTLSFDMAFLAILLSSLYEPETGERTVRCAVHPKQRHVAFSSAAIDYGADMDIALFRHKCLDSWRDERSLPGLGMQKLLARGYAQVQERWPRQCNAIGDAMERLCTLEKENCDDLDALCSCTGDMLAEVFVWQEDRWSDSLRAMAHALGAFIYLMDAYEDLERDAKRGAFNPLQRRKGDPDFEESCHDMLTMTAAQCAAAFETLPLVDDAGILRNTLYSGIWTKYECIRQKAMKAGKEKLDGQ